VSVTIKDVARVAEVSVASVSRALNDQPGSMTAATRKRILAAVKKLRYTPHSAARSLITRRTQTIGALLPDLHGEFFSELSEASTSRRARAACICSYRARTATRVRRQRRCAPCKAASTGCC